MSRSHHSESSASFPWGAVAFTAFLGGLTFLAVRRLRETGASAERSVDNAMGACDRALDALERRMSADASNNFIRKIAG